jgi:hypothetical protein
LYQGTPIILDQVTRCSVDFRQQRQAFRARKSRMSDYDETLRVKLRMVQCPHCGTHVSQLAKTCPVCRYPLGEQTADVPRPATMPLSRPPVTPPDVQTEAAQLTDEANVIFQVLPSGTCIALPLDRPIILGRATPADEGDILDLTHFNAAKHGVSRHHCELRRHDNLLFVTDLDSTNGTRLNGRLLAAQTETQVNHGDKLILGSLHIIIAFSNL